MFVPTRIRDEFFSLTLFVCSLLRAVVFAQTSVLTSRLPTGVRRNAVGNVIVLGSMPLNVVPALTADKAVVVLSGCREQGV